MKNVKKKYLEPTIERSLQRSERKFQKKITVEKFWKERKKEKVCVRKWKVKERKKNDMRTFSKKLRKRKKERTDEINGGQPKEIYGK